MSTAVEQLQGTTVFSTNGQRIGKVHEVCVTADPGHSWVAVHTGLFGEQEALIPISVGTIGWYGLIVTFDRQRMTFAPHRKRGTDPSAAEAMALCAFYCTPHDNLSFAHHDHLAAPAKCLRGSPWPEREHFGATRTATP